MNIVITSQRPHEGKTTCCYKLVERLRCDYSIGGILCPEDKIKNFNGDELLFYKKGYHISDFIKVGHCYINPKAMDFAYENVRNSKDKDFIFIDEYGPLEYRKKGLYSLIKEVIPLNKSIILVRGILIDKFLKEFDNNKFEIFELTMENRDSLDEKIYDYIRNQVR